MSNIIKVVADTSVYVAGALKTSYTHEFLLRRSKTTPPYILYTSHEILHELQQKLEQFGLEQKNIVDYIRSILAIATVVWPSQKITAVRDPNDDMILECAVEAKAHLIVTFDKDLLDMKTYEGIAISHPRMLQHWFKNH
jgi:putative PIN family toxin of toxin-antitoxin system